MGGVQKTLQLSKQKENWQIENVNTDSTLSPLLIIYWLKYGNKLSFSNLHKNNFRLAILSTMKCPVVVGAVTQDVLVTHVERTDLVWVSLEQTQEVENFLQKVSRDMTE